MSTANIYKVLVSAVVAAACALHRPVAAAGAGHTPSNITHLHDFNTSSPSRSRLDNHTDPRPISDFIVGFLDHAVKTSPYNQTITSIIKVLEPTAAGTGRSTPEAFYLVSLAKIVWQFVNGVAKPFLKTYLVPIQMLFTFMAPKMFLKDCFNVDTTALLTARSLSPFTVGPAAQAFFTCAVDIIAQVILCVKLLANMATSIF